jgi:NADH:ubiquinone oxidoreductase subunit
MAFRQLLNRLSWALFKRETVGFDAQGNKYYRLLDKTVEGDIIERRMVKYAGDWDPNEVPPEWLQWLRKVRSEPPTEVEMQAGEASRQVQRDRAESADAAAAEAAMRWQQGSGRSGGGRKSQFTQQLKQPSNK